MSVYLGSQSRAKAKSCRIKKSNRLGSWLYRRVRLQTGQTLLKTLPHLRLVQRRPLILTISLDLFPAPEQNVNRLFVEQGAGLGESALMDMDQGHLADDSL
jgi:hypothetical protein